MWSDPHGLDSGWHPLVATAHDMLTAQRIRPFDESVLARYYEVSNPVDARHAMIKPECGPSELSAYPPYTHHLPWLEVTPEQRSRHIAKIIVEENRALGAHELDASHGHGFHGPVSTAKGLLEFGRIRHLVESIGRSGYDRRISGADPTAEAIFRGNDFILRITDGHHRIAILAASGISHVPITVTKVVRADECEHWTSVVRGSWTKDQAMMLVEHLFLFDSMNWAIGKGLASGQPRGARSG